ncbi:MAG: alpha/beta fold hydrolase [Vicinamibacteria bacterium]|nr:alpha/beta fold hydrolase [Vicinamibacteria bacterium]
MREPRTIPYGPAADHQADFYAPAATRPPVVCLLHGGFWRMPYGRDQMAAVAEDLAGRGFAVWNLEYRRLGTGGAGFPGTMDDVGLGIDYLAKLPALGFDLDLDRVIVAGHSAGGHLALWAGGRAPSQAVRLRAVAGLAPIADLDRAYALRVGGEVVAELLGGAPAEYPDRLRAASPIEMLPLGVRQLILHGSDDAAVPIELSRGYARAAKAKGERIELIELPGTGHMEFLDPSTEAHAALCRWLEAAVR